MKRLLVIFVLVGLAFPVSAMAAIQDEAEFRGIIDGKSLVIRKYTLKLKVLQNGEIQGRAVGRDITGSWTWKNGYFCRDMKWGDRPIPYNCQLVEYDGTKVRFTTDKGQGRSADFDLR